MTDNMINTSLFRHCPKNAHVAYRNLDEVTLGLRYVWMKEEDNGSPHHDAMGNRYYPVKIVKNKYGFEVDGDLATISSMLIFIPALIADFIKAYNMRGIVPVSAGKLSMYLTVTSNWKFVIPYDLFDIMFPNNEVECDEELPHLLGVMMGGVKGKTQVNIVCNGNRINIATCDCQSPKLYSVVNTIRRVSEVALSILIGQIKQDMQTRPEAYCERRYEEPVFEDLNDKIKLVQNI